jgi:hypothetical protein
MDNTPAPFVKDRFKRYQHPVEDLGRPVTIERTIGLFRVCRNRLSIFYKSGINVDSTKTSFGLFNRMRSATRIASWIQSYPEIWVSLVLVLASHLFVSTFAKFAHWQFNATYVKTSDLCRWDCGWFRSVLDEGYDVEPYRAALGNGANWGFMPLFPLSALPFHYFLRLPTLLSLVLASKCALYTAILSFLLMVKGSLDSLPETFMAGGLVAFNPYVLYGHVGYSEPLYFALSSVAFIMLEKKNWILSGTAGALLSATRIVGCVFSLAYLVGAIKDLRFREVSRDCKLMILLGFMLCPLGLALYMLYLYVHTGDPLGFIHIQVVWGRIPHSPFVVILRALQHHRWQRVWGLMIIAGFLVIGWLLRNDRAEMAVYLAAAILIPLSADTWGFARYLWWQPPFLYALFMLLKKYSWAWPIYIAIAGGMASFMVIEWLAGTNVIVM